MLNKIHSIISTNLLINSLIDKVLVISTINVAEKTDGTP